jgi:prepilin-type N-terminal cleavage/methylation domain-containing protein
LRCRRADTRLPGTRRAGFTLLEVLAALGVCGIAVAALAPVFTANAWRARSADSRLALVDVARQTLELLPDRKEMDEGSIEGETGGVKWTMRTLALPDDGDDPERKIPWRAFRVIVDLAAPNGATAHVETVRLGRMARQ